MHKKLFNHCTINLTISPDGPILIKSGKEGADPTKPDMEFVETYHKDGGKTIYLPGSSLKGAIRAHAERIVRTIGQEDRDPNNSNVLWSNDPLNYDYKYLDKKPSYEVYKLSSFTDQLFGNTSLASRLRIEDAYPSSSVKLEERNGVAIDRVFGSVAVGPFNYQVCTDGEFKTKIHLKNFTLAQLGLIGLVLRDLNEGWFGLGFAKSRGMGTVSVKLDSAEVTYPTCLLKDSQIQLMGSNEMWCVNRLLGVGMFLSEEECKSYGLLQQGEKKDKIKEIEEQETDSQAQAMEFDFGVKLEWEGEEQVKDLFMRSVKAWSNKVQDVTAS
jgi:CRISPR/Cas system CSM-associated protein Csm3 (group 7 of RAMP superfamily)